MKAMPTTRLGPAVARWLVDNEHWFHSAPEMFA